MLFLLLPRHKHVGNSCRIGDHSCRMNVGNCRMSVHNSRMNVGNCGINVNNSSMNVGNCAMGVHNSGMSVGNCGAPRLGPASLSAGQLNVMSLTANYRVR